MSYAITEHEQVFVTVRLPDGSMEKIEIVEGKALIPAGCAIVSIGKRMSYKSSSVKIYLA